MDKFEYKIKADEIKELIAQGEYEQAAEIADSIDWRRVKSVMMLCTVSDLYKICRRYEDSRDMLLLAYERHPGGRTIVYALCELSIKMEEFVQAVEYYKEFVQIAPKDSGRYILQYKLYEAQDVSLEERIAVLEELKKRDYREKWAYELAYLYHRVGLATKCVEECDELILWFGEGKYVFKALELKKLHAPLTEQQQYIYDNRFGASQAEKEQQAAEDTVSSDDASQINEIHQTEMEGQDDVLNAPTTRIPMEEIDIRVKTLEVGKYDTINLQEELAAGIQEYFGANSEDNALQSNPAAAQKQDPADAVPDEAVYTEQEAVSEVFFGETGELETPGTDIRQLQYKTVGQVVEETRMMEAQPPKEMAEVLSMEADGQISFVLPEKEPVEKQITGQISINDIILEWERLKKENEEKRKEDVRQRVLQQTGQMFTEFEESVRDGLLEQLEKGQGQAETLDDRLAELFEENKQTTEPVEELVEVAVAEKPAEAEEEQPAEPAEEFVEVAVAEMPAEAEEEQPAEPAEEFVEVAVAEMPAEAEEKQPVEPAEEFVEEPVVEIPEESDDIGEVEELTEIEEAAEPVQEEAAEAETVKEEAAEAVPAEKEITETTGEKQKVRNLTREERELYGQYIQGRSSKEQIIKAVDGISMASYTGNLIVTGDEGMDSVGLAKNMIREIQMTDSNFSGKIAKISGETLNTRDVKQIVDDLNNGALIIQKAAKLNQETANALYKLLQQEHRGIVVVLEDCKKFMDRFLKKNEELRSCFTARVDIAALSNDALVAFGKKYAREKEYSIDEMGLLALHTRIEDMQTSDHSVTIMEVKEIMDEAMDHANRKSIGHFFDVLLARRYDDDDMIILKEKDFI